MNVARAFEIVLELARENTIADRECLDSAAMQQVRKEQIEACNIVEEVGIKAVEEIANFDED